MKSGKIVSQNLVIRWYVEEGITLLASVLRKEGSSGASVTLGTKKKTQ